MLFLQTFRCRSSRIELCLYWAHFLSLKINRFFETDQSLPPIVFAISNKQFDAVRVFPFLDLKNTVILTSKNVLQLENRAFKLGCFLWPLHYILNITFSFNNFWRNYVRSLIKVREFQTNTYYLYNMKSMQCYSSSSHAKNILETAEKHTNLNRKLCQFKLCAMRWNEFEHVIHLWLIAINSVHKSLHAYVNQFEIMQLLLCPVLKSFTVNKKLLLVLAKRKSLN